MTKLITEIIKYCFILSFIKNVIIEKKINIDEEIQKMVNIKTNNQLSQFSIIYFNKVKKDIVIDEI